MATLPDPYLLASTLLTPDEHLKLVLVTYDASYIHDHPPHHHHHLHHANSAPPAHAQRIFAIISNISTSVEQSCVLVLKPRRKDPNTAALLSVIPILPDLKIDIEPQQGLTASAAAPRNHPPAATTLGLSSLPQTLPTIHSLLESVVPEMFKPEDKQGSTNAELKFSLSIGGASSSGVTSDARGLKDFLSVLKDLLKVAQENGFEVNKTHQWMTAYTDDVQHHDTSQPPATDASGPPQLETPVFSRFSLSSFLPHTPTDSAIPRPASPAADDIRINVGTFNVNGHWPQDDIPGVIGLKKWLKAEQDPDLIVVGFQEFDNSSGAYLYYSPAREEAWVRAITQALGRRADLYRKIASKQLVGLMIIVFARTSIEDCIDEVATASVGVGLGGFVANKGAVAVRMKVARRTICFVDSHLSAFEGLQAMERRCWDWSEIYKRLRFRLVKVNGQVEDVSEVVGSKSVEAAEGMVDGGDFSVEQPANPFKTAQDAEHEDDSNGRAQRSGEEKGNENGAEKKDGDVKQAATVQVGAVDGANITQALAEDADSVDATALERSSHDSSDSSHSSTSSTSHIEHSINDHDVVINFGDLNFRLDLSHSQVHRLIRSRQYSLLYRYDQLESLRTSGSLFDGFDEGKIEFAPTYKFDKGTDRYDTSEKQRVPAWTDRVLWAVTKEWDEDDRTADSVTVEGQENEHGKDQERDKEEEEERKRREKERRQGVVLQSYESVTDLKFSDHRPVRATFLVRIR